MPATLVIALHTLQEARRRRILAAAVVLGLLLLGLFAVAYVLFERDLVRSGTPLPARRLLLNFLLLAGLYAVNFLTVMTAGFLPVDTLSGEIASGVMQPVAAKPVRRSAIVLGKWLGFAAIVAGYFALTAGGVLLIGRLVAGVTPPNLVFALPLLLLEAWVLMTVSLAGGTRLSTIANGVAVFGLFGLAFLGGWIEQISTMGGNETVRSIGTLASLLIPTEAMWQLAVHHMQPPVFRDLPATPFSPSSVPSGAMVVWAVGYVAVGLALAVRWFGRRLL